MNTPKKADYDCAIVGWEAQGEIEVFFARIPDPDVANTVFSFEEYPSIKVADEPQIIMSCTGETLNQDCNKRERTLYFINVPPVYELKRIANELKEAIATQHQFSVRLIFKEPPPRDYKTIAMRV